jgi:protein import protein ZIM17
MKHYLLLLLLRLIGVTKSFSFCSFFLNHHPLSAFLRLSSSQRRHTTTYLYSHEDDDDAEDTLPRGIPQLPATLSSPPSSTSTVNATTTTAFVGTKLQLQYTCQICETRNVHQVSRVAYRQGIVIAQCRGCENQHLIADHHWGGFTSRRRSANNGTSTDSDDANTINDIETYFQQQGKSVHRVSPQVFDLEQVWNVDTSSGSIVGENGERSLE